MTDQGPAAPLATRALAVATAAALLIASLALTLYILPANYGVDPTGAGKALGINAPSPAPAGDDDAATEEDLEDPPPTTNQTQLHRFEATWPTTTQDGPSHENYTAEGETTTLPLEPMPPNVTKLSVNLTWVDENRTADQESEPDELELVLEAPDGSTTDPVRGENEPGGQGTLDANLTLHAVPEARVLDAPDADEARQLALNETPDTDPEPWKVHVTVIEAGNAQAGDASLPATGSTADDEGTTWQLTTTARTYELALEDLGPAGYQNETQSFQLAPGESMEHKVFLEEDKTLEYAWEATGPVYYDFHGEPRDDPADFESYETATREEASGIFTAPFTGTHGWYWQNEANQPVTITLTTTGDYAEGFTT